MAKQRAEFVLASYATYKELYATGKYRSPYQLLSEFVNYIIYTEKLYHFSNSDMKKYMGDIFGFEVPYAVLKSTLKNTPGVNKVNNDQYVVDYDKIKSIEIFKTFKSNAEQNNDNLIKDLIRFTENRLNGVLSIADKQEVAQCFLAYLLDESNGGKYQDSISTYILSCEQNEEKCIQLQDIREGCILYTGIANSIEELGNISDNLTLYLDMEVLFNIIGYNGSLYKSLSMDMIELIKEINCNGKKIELKYFGDTKKEIEEYFDKAKNIVEGKELLREKLAMKTIVNGCENAADVYEKEADFFHILQYSYGIVEEMKTDFYTTDFYVANLERYSIDDPDEQESLKFISNINKLRNNKCYSEYLKSRYIFITETGKTLEWSKKLADELAEENGEKCVGFAIHTSTITNILWYKMNKGFGLNTFPQNINAVTKAKLVLSSSISHNVVCKYDKYKKEYDEKTITQEQFAARLLSLKNKASKPEDISFDSVEDDLNFDEEYLKRFEEEHNVQRVQLMQKEEMLAQKDEELITITKESQEKDSIIAKQESLLAYYQKKDEDEQNKQARKEKIFKIIRAICKRIVLIILIAVVSYYLAQNIVTCIDEGVVSITIGIIGIIISFCDFVKKGLMLELKEAVELIRKK